MTALSLQVLRQTSRLRDNLLMKEVMLARAEACWSDYEGAKKGDSSTCNFVFNILVGFSYVVFQNCPTLIPDFRHEEADISVSARTRLCVILRRSRNIFHILSCLLEAMIVSNVKISN